jgi:hypothetical protein
MDTPDDIRSEIELLRDLADDSGRNWYPSTVPQLGRISEVLRRVTLIKLPRLVRVRAVALLYDYDSELFLTTEQLSCQGAGAFITWAFVQHENDADLDTVPLREGASRTIRWAVETVCSTLTVEELAEDEAKQKARRRQYNQERYARRKREAASVRHQV